MTETYLLIAVLLINLAIVVALFRRKSSADSELLRPLFEGVNAETRRVETSIREEFTRQRGEMSREAQSLREEVNARLRESGDSNDQRFTRLRSELNDGASQARNEMRQGFQDFRTAVQTALTDAANGQGNQLKDFSGRLDKLNDVLGQHLDKVRSTMEAKLNELQNKNEQKLEEMRKTVDEKLEGTLKERLGEQFSLVSGKLELVNKAFGEMQAMASGVGDLKKVLTNVKTRGMWGEIQLGTLLEQFLTVDQFEADFTPRADSRERVEFAVRFPGRDGTVSSQVWLPIDAKFPIEDYQRLVDASEAGNAEGVNVARKALETRLRHEAKKISEKYIAPPRTTDFALLFLPSEALYAEAHRIPGLWNKLQLEFRVVLAGPSTISALVNSLQMGFKTLAIQKRSSEVREVLISVTKDFEEFGGLLAKAKQKIMEAGKQIEFGEKRAGKITKQLQDMQSPLGEQQKLIPDDELADSVAESVLAERALFDRQTHLGK